MLRTRAQFRTYKSLLGYPKEEEGNELREGYEPLSWQHILKTWPHCRPRARSERACCQQILIYAVLFRSLVLNDFDAHLQHIPPPPPPSQTRFVALFLLTENVTDTCQETLAVTPSRAQAVSGGGDAPESAYFTPRRYHSAQAGRAQAGSRTVRDWAYTLGDAPGERGGDGLERAVYGLSRPTIT